MTTLTALCTLVAVGILLIILIYIAMQGIGSLSFRFLVDSPRPVGEGGGIGNAISGTLVLLGLSAAIGLPFGIAVGIYLSEFGSGKFGSLVRFLTDTLTGIPSIVTGVFVYTIVVVPLKHFSALAGGIALALIMVPIVARTTEEMIKLVPHSLREGALALGAPQWRTTLGVVIPAAASGIATGAMLAIARISGETAPLLFTALSNQFWSLDVSQPMANLPVTIYKFAMSPFSDWQQLAWAGVFLITLGVLLLNVLARVMFKEGIKQ
jgi:phosphate transport system permease protein